MPMVARVASGSITGGSGIAAGAPTRLITTATITAPAVSSNLANQPGMYVVAWQYLVTGGASGGGTAQVPCFTWRDPDMNVGVTATASYYAGGILNGGIATSLSGQPSASAGISAAASSHARGFEIFQCGSGASGVSAYLQVSSLSTGGGTCRFDYQVFCVDNWGV